MDNWLETKQFPTHFVSAAGVVYREDGKVLLIRSARRGWEFPGGVVEPGEGILDGLKREILEESGVTAEPVCLTSVYQNLARKKGYGPLEGMTLPTTVNMFFRCRWVSGEGTVTEESLERKPGYRYSLIVLNDMDSMLNLSDEEYATVFQCYLRDEFCIVACVGKNHFSKLVKLGLIKNEKWIQPEDYCVFYHRSKSGKMTSTFGLYTETDIENDFSMCMCLLQGFKSIVEAEK